MTAAKRTHVLIIHPYFLAQGDSGADGVRQVIKSHLSKADWTKFDYTVAVPADGPFVDEYRECGPVRIFDLSIRDHIILRRSRNPFYYAGYAVKLPIQIVRLARYITANGVDLVHSHGSAYLGGVLAARLTRKPGLLHVHEGGERLNSTLATIYRKISLTTATTIIASARRIAEDFGPAGKNTIKTVYNGVDLDRFTPEGTPLNLSARYGIPSTSQVIGFVGRIHPRKDLILMVDAFRRILARVPDSYLVLAAGSDNATTRAYEQQVKSHVAKSGLSDRVIFDTGFIEDIPALFRSLSLTMYTAPIDYLPMAILESMATGTPVVNASEGGPRETVVDGESGLQVMSRDPIMIGDATADLLLDAPTLKEMNSGARSRAEQLFDANKFARTLEGIYTETIRARSG